MFSGTIPMRKFLLILTIAGAIAPVAPATAMPLAPASDLAKAAAATRPLDQVVYICKQRYWSGKRYCYWRPGGYHWRWRLWR